MTKWLVAAAAIGIVAMPVASAASPSQDRPKPATTAQGQSSDNWNVADVLGAHPTDGYEAIIVRDA